MPGAFRDFESYFQHLKCTVEGKTVRATGMVIGYDGVPEIIVTSQDQLSL